MTSREGSSSSEPGIGAPVGPGPRFSPSGQARWRLRDGVLDLAQPLVMARKAGIQDDRLVVNPGIGFAKTGPQSLALLARLGELVQALAVAQAIVEVAE